MQNDFSNTFFEIILRENAEGSANQKSVRRWHLSLTSEREVMGSIQRERGHGLYSERERSRALFRKR